MAQPADRPDRSGGADTVATRHLRSALEFAVLVAREGPKLKPPLAIPNGLRRYVKQDRLTTASLNGVRRVLDADDDFRSRLAVGAIDDVVDEVGRLWLRRPTGWEHDIGDAVERVEREAADADLARQLKRAEKRREAAERGAARSVAELAERDSRLDALQTALGEAETRLRELEARRDELVAQLESAKMDARHAHDRELAAVDRAQAAMRRADDLAAERSSDPGPGESAVAEPAVDEPAGDESGGGDPDRGVVPEQGDRIELDPDRVEQLSETAAQLARDLAALAGLGESPDGPHPSPDRDAPDRDAPDRRAVTRRRPLRMPPGVLGTSTAGARFLMRAGVPVLVDGYNVSKLAWGRLDLAAQRDRLVTALEMVSRRYGAEIVVVFDGADVVGGHRGRHTGVSVVFSAADESADDWIRTETRRIIGHRNVVVVTNDREIIDGVVAVGANHVSSEQLIDLLG